MPRRFKLTASLAAVLAAAALILAAGCAVPEGGGIAGEKGPIVVGSKIDGEGSLLGQMIIALLRAKGFQTVDKTRTGATDVVRKALLVGQIDIYPEYTANALLVFHRDEKVDPAVLKDAKATWEAAKRLDATAGVVWLAPAPANNTWALAVTRDFARTNNVRSMADWAAYVNGRNPVKVVGSQEFFTSPAAMPAFEKAYDFRLTPDQTIALATGDTAVTEKAVSNGTNGANAAMAYGTDGSINALGLVVLSDPKAAQPVYQPAPTVRKAVYERYPELSSILDPVFRKLTLETLQRLNAEVSVEGKDPQAVAEGWLRSEGFLE